MMARLLLLAGAVLVARRIIEENRSEPVLLLPSPGRVARVTRNRKNVRR
jgi:hypothetical protein